MPTAKYIPVPDQKAITFIRGKLNITTERWGELLKEPHAKAFTVAGATKLELLKDFRAAVQLAIESGESIGSFRKRFDEVVAEHGWEYKGERGWRTRIIYDTNMRTARQAGRWQRMQDNKANRPYLMYRTVGDNRVRQEHQDWNRLILHIDDPFWKTHYPLNGFGCRCGVRSVSKRDLERKGWKVSDAPAIKTSERISTTTGEVYGEVPVGIDVGWDYNVGQAWMDKTNQVAVKQASSKLQQAFEDVLTEAQDEVKALPSAFSTVKGVDHAGINNVLMAMADEGNERVKKLAEFTERKQIKTLLVKQSEMGISNKSARAIEDQVSEYLGNDRGRFNYVTRKQSRVNGFTSVLYDHVVVKAGNKHRYAKADKPKILAAINQAVDTVFDEPEKKWSVSGEADMMPAQLIITWLHEVGHQVHYWAGAPQPPAQSKRLTRYSRANGYEYHAETFVLWLLNRDRLMEIDPVSVQHFDDLIGTAIASERKRR